MKKIASLFLAAAFIAGPATAQAQIWTGAGPDNNWSTGANWSGGVAPASSPTTQVHFPSGTPRSSPIVDAPWTVNRLSSGDPLGGSYTLGGQAITLDGVGQRIGVSFGSLTVSNPIVLAGPTEILGCRGNLTVDGAISGPGSLNLSGRSSVTTLRGAHTYAGGTTIRDVTLNLRGSISGPVSIGSSNVTTPCSGGGPGILTGSGTVNGPVRVSGFSTDLLPDLVLSTGDLTLAEGSRLSITINGPARGIQYATVNVTGAVAISRTGASAPGATLRLLGSYTPVTGDVFTIVANDGSDPVVPAILGEPAGTFAGLPEGATVTFNGVPLRLSYVGGTGNDVTLTASAAAVAPDVRQVPTLSGWALIVLASMLLGVGMLRSRRRDRETE